MAYSYCPLLIVIVLANISLFVTLASGQLTADGTQVASVTVIGTVGCASAQLNLVTPYLSCDSGATSVANGTVVNAAGFYNILLNSVNVGGNPNPISIETPQCAVFIRLPIQNCAAFPQSSGLIRANLTGLRIRAAGPGLAGFVALYRAGRFRLV